jgi:pimeloyl-ACP methyl ester carboxylesterase
LPARFASANTTEGVLRSKLRAWKVAALVAAHRPAGLAGVILVAPAQPKPADIPAEVRQSMAQAYLSRDSVLAAIEQVLTVLPLSAEIREQVVEDSLRGNPRARDAWPAGVVVEDSSGDVGTIDVPVLVVAYLPRSRLEVLPGTGHLSPLEVPEAVAQVIRDFCVTCQSAT